MLDYNLLKLVINRKNKLKAIYEITIYMKKIVLLANRRARKLQHNIHIIYEIQNFLAKFFDTRLHFIDSCDVLAKLAKKYEDNTDNIIVSCGGDGTFLSILNSFKNPNTIYGIIPCGTANTIANELGISTNHILAAKTIISGTIRKFDVGKFDKYKFLMAAGVEFDGYVIKHVMPAFKKMLGKYSYYLALLPSYLTYKPKSFEIITEGADYFRTNFVIFQNFRLYAGNLSFDLDTYYNDGLLNMLAFKKFDINSLFKAYIDAKFRREIRNTIVSKCKAKKFLVKSCESFIYQLDGEAFYSDKLEVEVGIHDEKIKLVVI